MDFEEAAEIEANTPITTGSIFSNCNVCGIKLRYFHEDELGMCDNCAWGIEQDAIREEFELYQEDHREVEDD